MLAQDPGGGTQQPPGTTVTLTVSKGPSTSLVPDVTSLDEQSATDDADERRLQGQLEQPERAELRGRTGIVLRQNPLGGASARPGATVTIVVGRFVAAPPTTTTTPTDTTTTDPTTTTPGGQ